MFFSTRFVNAGRVHARTHYTWPVNRALHDDPCSRSVDRPAPVNPGSVYRTLGRCRLRPFDNVDQSIFDAEIKPREG